MRYAVLSDIHGNMPALRTVLRDAEARGANRYLLLGDYQGELCWPNDVARCVQSLPACLVKGNREDYLARLEGADPAAWTDRQQAAVYWNYRALTAEHRASLLALPNTHTVQTPGLPAIHMAHAPFQHFGKTCLDALTDEAYVHTYKGRTVDYAGYCADAHALVAGDAPTKAALSRAPEGVYLFGHFHSQFHIAWEGRLLVNPGAVGLPTKFCREAAYTLITAMDGAWRVEARSVPYDTQSVCRSLMSSSLYRAAPVWIDLALAQLLTGVPQHSRFLRIVEHLTEARGTRRNPYADDVWMEAARVWRGEQK